MINWKTITHQQLVNWIRKINFLLAIVNLINCFLFWWLIFQLYILITAPFHQPVSLDLAKNLIISLVTFFFLASLVAIGGLLLSLYVGQLKTHRWQFYSLVFFLPIGLFLLYYVFHQKYWLVQNPQQLVNWQWTRDNDLVVSNPPQLSPKSNYQQQKIIVRTQNLLNQLVEQKVSGLNKITWNLFHKTAPKTQLQNEPFSQVLVLKAIIELIPQKLWSYLVFNPPSQLGIRFAFALTQGANRRRQLMEKISPQIKNYYFQLYAVFNVFVDGYDQLLAAKHILKHSRQSLNSLYIFLYTTKVHKTFFNQPQKSSYNRS